jgi:alpha/beta superfamily hydrolase
MPAKKTQSKPASRPPAHASEARHRSAHAHPSQPPTVSGRWLLAAAGTALVAAAVCSWAALCLLFWQGSWQLLYHPRSAVARTPANIGLAFDPVGFATTEAGQPELSGWWIPAGQGAPFSLYTVVCLHGQDGNLGDTLKTLGALHNVGVNALAFDYRGYGQSLFVHPSEAHWREDAESALLYLTGTRHIEPGSIVLDGSSLGANLALEIAAAHPGLAGVVLRQPLDAPLNAVFNDARAHMVPTRLLVSDRYDLIQPAAHLSIPSLWLLDSAPAGSAGAQVQSAYDKVKSPKEMIRLAELPHPEKDSESALVRWLQSLPSPVKNR